MRIGRKFIMKCSKCGAECNENLAFCLECGNPLQLMADFNLIEKELANSIGEFMDEIEHEEIETFEEEDDMKTIDVPLDEINMELKIVDINRSVSKSQNANIEELILEDDEDEDISPVYIPRNKRKNDKKKKNNKKKFIIIGSVVAAIVLVVLAVVLLFGKDDKKEKPVTKDFAYYYDLADENLKDSKLDNALDNALLALDNAKNDDEILKARLLVKKTYEEQKYTGEYYMENLEELFKLGEDSQENAAILLGNYAEKKDVAGLVSMFGYVTEDVAREILGEAFIEKPEVSIPSGEYKNVISVEIVADKDSAIYYAVYRPDETVEYKEYKGNVEIAELGEFTLETYSVNAEGMASYKEVCNYKVVEGEMTGPVITPEAGTYKEPTMITINIPEGGKVYYTYDGTQPTSKSTEYTEPVEMLKGVNTFKAILIDKFGNESEVSSYTYNLKLTRNETVTTAKDKIWNYYLNNGLIDAEGKMADGSVISISYHNAYDIDNGEYYVYQVFATSTDGTTSGVTYCGVNTFDGKVCVGLIEDGASFVIQESESAE